MKYDAIIIGAGPAGGMASYILTEKGFSVLILEKKKEVGMPVQCGEAITQFSLKNVGLLLDDSWIKWKVKGIKIILPQNMYFYSAEPGMAIDRYLFDKWLIKKSVESGAELVTNAKVTNIKGRAGEWNVKGGDRDYEGKIIIGADGPLSWVAKHFNLFIGGKYLRAYQYKFDAEFIDYPEREWFVMYWLTLFKGWYGWVFPRGDEYSVGVVSMNANKYLLQKFCNYIGISPKKRKSITAGLIPFNFSFKSRAIDGIMIVGDAAGTTNPVTCGGIHAALASGKLAGEVAVKCLEENDYSLTKQYDVMIKKTPYLDKRQMMTAKYFQQWGENERLFLGKIMHGKSLDEVTLFKCFIAALNHPKFLFRAREMLIVRKTMLINKKYGW